MDKNFWQGFWRLSDPKISLASFAGLTLAAFMAFADQGLAWGWLLLTVLGVFAVEVAKNASGEVVDFNSGTDLAVSKENRSPFSGGKRVLVDSLMSREQTMLVAKLFYALAVVIGLFIVFFREEQVLVLGLIGIALAWFYHSDPLQLSYRGWGELAVAICYGPLVVSGTYLVQAGTVSSLVLSVSLVLGLLVAAFLWINEFPDYHADRACGKRNLVVRMGLQPAIACYALILLTAYAWLLFIVCYFADTAGLALGFLGAPAALYSSWRLYASAGITRQLIPAQIACLASFVIMAVASGVGYLLL